MKSRFASVIFVVVVLLPVSLAICVPAARARSRGEVVLHSFNGTDGGVPTTGVIQGSDGNFYQCIPFHQRGRRLDAGSMVDGAGGCV